MRPTDVPGDPGGTEAAGDFDDYSDSRKMRILVERLEDPDLH